LDLGEIHGSRIPDATRMFLPLVVAQLCWGTGLSTFFQRKWSKHSLVPVQPQLYTMEVPLAPVPTFFLGLYPPLPLGVNCLFVLNRNRTSHIKIYTIFFPGILGRENISLAFSS
jgi:hypothetical protein